MRDGLIVADHLSHQFQKRDGRVSALRDISLTVASGEFLAIVGPSGSGKSTLLRLFAGLLQPSEGCILYHGAPLTGTPPDISVVFQKPALLPWRTVADNIALPLQLSGEGSAQQRIAPLIEAVGLHGFGAAMPHELSGGMQQRVSLARALVSQPRLLLMDEPFAALDMMLRGEMNRLLLGLWEETRPTVVFVTHDLHEAVFLADRVIALSPRPGRVLRELAIELPRPRHTIERYGHDVQPYVEQLGALYERLGSHEPAS